MRSDSIRLSVVVPAGPGESAWTALPALLAPLQVRHEIVLSTATEPMNDPPAPVRVVQGPSGRAQQLNAGVAASRGDWLWLLHADSRPGPDTLRAATAFIAAREHPVQASLGWFELAFDGDGPAAVSLNARGANLRSRWLGLPFGDQGWLMSRRTFERVGRFDAGFGRGEDLEYIVRARRRGVRLNPAGAVLITSARRYRDRGWLRTTAAHAWFTLWLWTRAEMRNCSKRT